jgi:ferredoxin
MAIEKVWLDESDDECISCGNCEAICPEVFQVPDKMVVVADADLIANEEKILEAVEACPTNVIKTA